jgi:hypothetical protein
VTTLRGSRVTRQVIFAGQPVEHQPDVRVVDLTLREPQGVAEAVPEALTLKIAPPPSACVAVSARIRTIRIRHGCLVLGEGR